jgi:hypothetical protein
VQLHERELSEEEVSQVVSAPEQVVDAERQRRIAQQRVRRSDGEYLLASYLRGAGRRHPGDNDLSDVEDIQVLETDMRIRYDPTVDALYIRLREEPVKESDEVASGVILDYDKNG